MTLFKRLIIQKSYEILRYTSSCRYCFTKDGNVVWKCNETYFWNSTQHFPIS